MIATLTRLAHWIGGTVLALAGVLVSHWPVSTASAAMATRGGGQLLAFAGLAWIAIGVSRRATRNSLQ